jgi:hypothetical protein
LHHQEQEFKQIAPELNALYLADNAPGIKYYKGKEELKHIYDEQIKSGKPIYFVKTHADFDYYGFKYLTQIRLAPAKYGIKKYGLVPDRKESNPTKKEDELCLLDRTWLDPKDYTAKVEWGVFGDKVSAISFGKEGVGMIIESPQIAESMRQIFKLAEAGAKARYPVPKYGYKKTKQ